MSELPSNPNAKLMQGHPFFDLIEEAYRVFKCPAPKSTEVCIECCMDPYIEKHFFDPPIRELPLYYVQDWYDAAYQPPGVAKSTWAYLLPRILEILACGEDASRAAIEVSLNRFQTGNPARWTEKQWSVLDRFQRQFLSAGNREDAELDDMLCMFRLAGWQLTDLLSQVDAMPPEWLARQLWHGWCAHRVPGREDVWVTAFWEGSDPTTVYDYYTSSSLYDRMVALALNETTDPEVAEKATCVADVIGKSKNSQAD